MNNGQLVTIQEDNFEVAEFETYDDAYDIIKYHPLRVFDYEIVEVRV